jgi:multidrug efflux pump
VKEAAATRLRPILMTSVATVFGHLPLTFVSGPGAEARNSIGLVLVAGMAVGTAFTLFFLPAIYVLIARDRRVAAHSSAASGLPSPGEGLALGGPLQLARQEVALRGGRPGEGT